jgi:protein required for attachment to host cells
MSKNNWLVVAHRAGARIFCRGDAPHSLECVARFEHPQAHLHEREFGSDRPGRATVSSRAGRHAMTNETPASETSLRMFAERIADYLETARLDHRLERLSLVAEPHMLGLLRAALTTGTAAIVTASLDKDLVHVADGDLASWLQDARFWI